MKERGENMVEGWGQPVAFRVQAGRAGGVVWASHLCQTPRLQLPPRSKASRPTVPGWERSRQHWREWGLLLPPLLSP